MAVAIVLYVYVAVCVGAIVSRLYTRDEKSRVVGPIVFGLLWSGILWLVPFIIDSPPWRKTTEINS